MASSVTDPVLVRSTGVSVVHFKIVFSSAK